MVDPRYGNSSGYFKDPITGDDLSPDTPRVVPCELRDGKFVWPMVLRSDGEEPLKIVYRYFTDEEKELYKQYRGRGTNTGHSQVRSKKQKQIQERQPPKEVSIENKIVHKPALAVSEQTRKIIEDCDQYLGCLQTDGVYYGMLSRKDSSTTYMVPLDCIDQAEMTRLCKGD